jgi:predicted ATPase/DNA-binding winged helix-turn-helix (wHTH) protein
MAEGVHRQDSEAAYAFGAFQLLPRARVLLDDGRPVRLGSRGFELLSLLVERAGEVVSNDDLVQRAWPTTTVTEQNLRVQIAALRKVLQEGERQDIILNLPGRGYQCVARVMPSVAIAGADWPSRLSTSYLPALLTDVYGRTEVLANIASRLASDRLVTVVGPGGVGKTTVAIAAAQAFGADPVWFVDLAPLAHDTLIPASVAAALGQSALSDDALSGLKTYLRDKRALMVLDNCEHLVGACADVVAELLGAAPGLRILATSREPLRTAGEWVFRLSGLPTPADRDGGRATAMACAAVQLFVDRASSQASGFRLTDADVPVVVDICRQLDGLPLALELAAARVGVLGLRETAAHLKERWRGAAQGGRTGPQRHAALTTALDWSYDLLSPAEQALLRQLSVFSGAFALRSARDMGSAAGADSGEVVESLSSLVDKSLVNVDLSREPVRYRLLQMTRDYAAGKLEAVELAAVRARHAQQQRVLLREAEAGWSFERGSEWIPLYAGMVDDVRAALEWALSPSGDLDLAVDLAVESLPLWHDLSLARDYVVRVDALLERVRSLAPPNGEAEMRLLGVYGVAQTFIDISRASIDRWTRVRALAVELGDVDHQLLALWGLWFGAAFPGAVRKAREFASDFAALVPSRPTLANRAVAQQMMAQAEFSVGEYANARHHVGQALDLYAQVTDQWGIARTWYDPFVLQHALLSKVLWVQGLSDQAQDVAQVCVEEAKRRSHTFTTSFALVEAGAQIALLNGDLIAAEHAINDHRQRSNVPDVREGTLQSNDGMAGLLCAARGDLAGAAQLLLKTIRRNYGFVVRFPALIGPIAETLGACGSPAEGLALLDGVRATIARDPTFWCQPELLRVRGVLAWRLGGPEGLAEAETHFQAALAQARAQGALAWELRAAISQAELWRDTGRAAAGADLLDSVLGRLEEGFGAADFIRAAQLQEDIGREVGTRRSGVTRKPQKGVWVGR